MNRCPGTGTRPAQQSGHTGITWQCGVCGQWLHDGYLDNTSRLRAHLRTATAVQLDLGGV